MGGTTLVVLWEGWLRNKKYIIALANITVSYSIIYLLVAIPTGNYFQSHRLNIPYFSPEALLATFDNLFKVATLQSYTFWLFVVLLTLLFLQVNDKYGPGTFKDFLLGKYFQPQREERIFMFLDLRSSTAIAERLKEEKYFNFLRDCFKFSTPAILNSKGEIYQYVGDEIVISWKIENGIKHGNCINCFFEVQKALESKTEYFQEQYGEIPKFKAGIHYGFVMTGEIGIVKREIAFSGDVLNTTARIQQKCNEFGVDLLFSKKIFDKIAATISDFKPREMGRLLLRGKEEEVSLYTV